MITRSNYEIFFIDYFDGNLDAKQQEEVFAFIEMNPDLKIEFERYSDVKAESESTIVFNGKERLKKDTITVYNYKSWFVAFIENDLSKIQKAELHSFLANNKNLKPELELLKRSKFVPENEVIFSKKIELKKKAKVIQFNFNSAKRIAAAAAVAIIFLISYFLVQKENPKTEITHKETKVEKPIQQNSSTTISNQKEIANSNILPVGSENKSVKKKKAKPDESKKVEIIPIEKNELAVKGSNRDLQPLEAKTVENISSLNLESDSTLNTKTAKANFQNKEEIFSDEELRDLQNLAVNIKEKEQPSSSFLNLAEKRIKKLTAPTDVSFESDKSNGFITYAFEIGKNFSISHTTTK